MAATDLDLLRRDQRPRDARAQQVILLVNRVGNAIHAPDGL